MASNDLRKMHKINSFVAVTQPYDSPFEMQHEYAILKCYECAILKCSENFIKDEIIRCIDGC